MKTVLIVGAGTMGQMIGAQCAACGFNVTLYDTSQEILDKALVSIQEVIHSLAGGMRITKEAADSAMDLIRTTIDADDAGKDADIISESVPEDPKLKAKVFAMFNEICPKETIFTTNTSTLVPSQIAEETGRPELFAALHFHDIRLSNVVDIMPHPGTSEETTNAIRQFAVAIDQYPIELKKEQPGYVFNTMISQLLSSAMTLASNEIASVEDIDRAWMGVMKSPVGPFGIMDSVGLETVWKITDYWAEVTGDAQGKKNGDYIKSFVDKGDLGIKTGKGFYEYPEAAYFTPEFMKGIK